MSSSRTVTAIASSVPSTVISNTSIDIPPDEFDDEDGPRQSFRLTGSEVLVKVSHVNDALFDLKVEVFDDEEKEECQFMRIIRIGPGIKNKNATVPGALIVSQRCVGIFLDKLSEAYGETYYLLDESDIMTYIDM